MAISPGEFQELLELRSLRRQVAESEPRFNELTDQLISHLENRDWKSAIIHGHEVKLGVGEYSIDWRRLYVEAFGAKRAKAEERRHLRIPLAIIDGSEI